MVLDIDKYLESPPRNRIRLVGIELEGLWTKIPLGGEANFHNDGSVKFPPIVVDGKPISARVGEIVSWPIEPAAIGKWVRHNYPQAVNETCGLHIHMSFWQVRHYHRLMVQDYQDTMIEYLKRWAKEEGTFPEERTCMNCLFIKSPLCMACRGTGNIPGHHIWNRLAGKEKYCHFKFWPDAQVQMTRHGDQASPDRFWKEGSRYTAVNYCFGIDNRQTLEIRVLPMMEDPEQAIRALKRIVRVTNACLYVLRKNTRRDKLKFKLPPISEEPVIEEEIITL